MGLLGRKAKRDVAFADARLAVQVYWGSSTGGSYALADADSRLRDAQLTLEQLHQLRVNLPIGCDGTTGQRVERIDRVLKGLEYEAGREA
jgi:hypothetical protein